MTLKHQKIRSDITKLGFLLLSSMVFILYFLVTSNSIRITVNVPSMIILLLALTGIIYTLIREAIALRSFSTEEKVLSKDNLLIFTAVFLGAVITYVLSIYAGLGAVLASGLVGVAAAVFLKNYAAPVFCGSFAGMSSALLLNHWEILIAAVFAGIIYVLAKNTLNGFGGKFGTIAFTACLLASVITGSNVTAKAFGGWDIGLILIGVSVLAAVLTYVLSIRLKLGPVLASALVGVMTGLWLPMILPENGALIAVMAFCASFAGMSSPKRLPNELYIAAAGLISGFAFIFSYTMQGAGGKLGTIAFGSAMAVYALSLLVKKLRKA